MRLEKGGKTKAKTNIEVFADPQNKLWRHKLKEQESKAILELYTKVCLTFSVRKRKR